MKTFIITDSDLEKLKDLIAEFSTYYEDNEDNKDEDGETIPWDFDDVDNQRLIGLDIINIIRPIIDKI